MVRNPPLYEVDGPDGPVTQKWRGMPKLPDLIETMLSSREKLSNEARRRQEQFEAEEMRRLEQRRAEHPEEFIGWADVVKKLRDDRPDLFQKESPDRDGVKTTNAMPVEPVSTILMSDEAANRRRAKMIEDLKKHEAEKYQPREEVS